MENKIVGQPYYDVRSSLRIFSKYAVALRAVALLEEGDSMLIDAGTSLTPIAMIIRKLAEKSPDQTHYTIMTHNQAAFDALSDTPPEARFNVFQTGGRYDRDLNASFGHQAEMAYLRYHPRWIFIGQNGLVADLGLFCHGNTEELALKKEIFSMAAWGRVIISDYSKIGVPGGLLFGDSMNLTTNVNECWIITDDIHDEKFKPDHYNESFKQRQERFENQIRSLDETYQSIVEPTHFIVLFSEERASNKKKNFKFLSDPTAFYEKQKEKGNISGVYRIAITKDDIRNNSMYHAIEKEKNIYVDITFKKSKDGDKIETIINDAELFWDSKGRSVVRRYGEGR